MRSNEKSPWLTQPRLAYALGNSSGRRSGLLPTREYAARQGYARAAGQVPALSPDTGSYEQQYADARVSLPRFWADQRAKEAFALVLLIPAVLLIHGYHPWSDDAAIYISGLRKMMHPALYPRDAAFVLAHTRVSIFSHVLAMLATAFDLRLTYLLLTAYLVSAWLFLFACRRFAVRVFQSEPVSWVATLIATACFTLPVAGTALFVMDPYLSARSFSTPLSILAVTAALDRRWMWTGLWAILAVAMHPQMGVYAAGFITVLILVDRGRWRTAVAVSVLAVLGCGGLWLATLHTPVTAAYREAVLSRTYFFPGLWQWYEWVGLAAPLVLLAAGWRRCAPGSAARSIAAASVLVGTAACVAAFGFVHTQGPYLLARVQLLRSFQLIYDLGLILLGGWIGQVFSARHRWVSAALILIAAAGMFTAEVRMYPGSAHLEWPNSTPVNPWGQALVWIRTHTPENAVFAISPHLLASPAEDLPGFRALADRSVLVDNKDEGVASIFPDVAAAWKQRSEAVAQLATMSPAERAARLAPFGVQWLLLPPKSAASLSCPYRNAVVAVCRMTE